MKLFIDKFCYYAYRFLSQIFPDKSLGLKKKKFEIRLRKDEIIKTGARREYAQSLIHKGLLPGRFMTGEKEVDVIIPVYAGNEATRTCIRSVLGTLPSWARIIAINDASPDEPLSAWLREQAGIHGFALIEHEKNMGFVETVNHGMKINPAHDVVLLNSDTEVANDWLERMRAAAYSMEKIASLTPFSNNGYLCSFPNFCCDNEPPGGLGVAEVDEIFSKFGKIDEMIELPTGVGFCMYIRRECLDEIGLFDAKTFGRGYGEETDWCQRAAEMGWKNCQQLNLFVYHKGGLSFGSEGNTRKRDAFKIIKTKYPPFAENENLFRVLDPARETREFILSKMNARNAAVQSD
jgi:GT2 family glycosyltransferase